jgi:hypothetical protein
MGREVVRPDHELNLLGWNARQFTFKLIRAGDRSSWPVSALKKRSGPTPPTCGRAARILPLPENVAAQEKRMRLFGQAS